MVKLSIYENVECTSKLELWDYPRKPTIIYNPVETLYLKIALDEFESHPLYRFHVYIDG